MAGAKVDLSVVAVQPGVGPPAQRQEHQAEHAEGQEEAARVDVHRDDGEAGDGARDCRGGFRFKTGAYLSARGC